MRKESGTHARKSNGGGRGAGRGGAALRLDEMRFDTDGAVRRCDHPNCNLEAEHRAPKSPSRLNEYHWFCLEHVRDYNKAWNFYANMSDVELEAAIRKATTWERPSWPFGTRRDDGRTFAGASFKDDFGVFDDDPDFAEPGGQKTRQSASTPEAKACAVMGLTPPVTLDEVKSRYKHLVKLNHPDRNGGDKDAEERLKLINEAYTTLKRFLT